MSIPFEYVSGELKSGGVSLDELANHYGTPLYVYHLPAIEARLAALRASFRSVPTRVCYSVKANSNLHLLKWFHEQGVGFDVVSGGELARLEALGVSGDRVVFAGVGKTRREIAMAVDAGLWMITIETLDELDLLREVVDGRDERVRVALRVNPDVDAGTHPNITTGRGADKFGLDGAEFEAAVDTIAGQDAVHLVGLHMHLGSQIVETWPYHEGLRVLARCAERVRQAGGEIRYVNAGGGFGIDYGTERVPSIDAFAEAIVPAATEIGGELVLELGRHLVGPAGCLVTEVLSRKPRSPRNLLIVDAGMTDLLRPALYGASHRVRSLIEGDATWPVDVAGPICESSDVLARECALPEVARGDRLAILDVGAYGMSMASHYNTHPRAAEVWILGDGSVEEIRRRETYDDVLKVERESLDR